MTPRSSARAATRSSFGLAAASLQVQGNGLNNGWFNNGGGGQSRLRIATGAFVDMTTGDHHR